MSPLEIAAGIVLGLALARVLNLAAFVLWTRWLGYATARRVLHDRTLPWWWFALALLFTGEDPREPRR